MVGDGQAKRLKAPRNSHSDATHPEKADAAVAQAGRCQSILALLRPLAFAEPALGLGQLTHCHEEQSQRGVRYFFRQHVGRVGDDDSALSGCRGIHAVVTDAEIADDPQLRQTRHQCVVDFHTGERTRADRLEHVAFGGERRL